MPVRTRAVVTAMAVALKALLRLDRSVRLEIR